MNKPILRSFCREIFSMGATCATNAEYTEMASGAPSGSTKSNRRRCSFGVGLNISSGSAWNKHNFGQVLWQNWPETINLRSSGTRQFHTIPRSNSKSSVAIFWPSWKIGPGDLYHGPSIHLERVALDMFTGNWQKMLANTHGVAILEPIESGRLVRIFYVISPIKTSKNHSDF